MAEIATGLGFLSRALDGLRSARLGRLSIGIFLILAFTATSAVLLFVITAEQLQNSIATADLGNTKTTIGAIRQDVTEVEHYYTVMSAIAQKQVETEQAQFQANIAKQSALVKLINLTNRIRSYINLFNSRAILDPLKIQPFPEAPGGNGTDKALVFDQTVADYFAGYYKALAALPPPQAAAAGKARAALETFKDQVYGKLDDYVVALAAYNAADSAVAALQGQGAALQKDKKAFDASVGAPGTALANDNYWNLCEDFYSFKTLVGDWAYKIVLLPKMMLVLMLAIFMGVLGSLICISRDFLKNPDERSFWEILFRIGLGAGVAFALFFFAAAGMMAFSQGTSAGGGEAQMSPYLISFLGITAGYLSDRVTEWMREVGLRTFKLTEDDPDRWGIGLKDELAKQSVALPQLAKAVGVPAEEVQAWCETEKPVPSESQKALALYLHADRSRLFTDLEPAGA
jgi:hypothetical protein